MVTTDKNAVVNEFDIVVRVGKFKEQGKKLVIQKGSTIISVPAEDVYELIGVIGRTANFKYESKCIAQFDDAPNPADGGLFCDTCPAR